MILNDRKKISVSAVSVEDYEDFFATRLTEAKELIHISVAMNFGKSYYNASNAAKCFGSVNVVNSGQLSCGMRIVLKYAAQKLSEGATAKEVITTINFVKILQILFIRKKSGKNIRIYLDKSGYFDKIYVSAIKYRYLTVDAQYTTGGRLGFRLCLV